MKPANRLRRRATGPAIYSPGIINSGGPFAPPQDWGGAKSGYLVTTMREKLQRPATLELLGKKESLVCIE